jgi:hypothetical protein
VTWNTLLPPPSCFLPRTNNVEYCSSFRFGRACTSIKGRQTPGNPYATSRYFMERHLLSFGQRTNLAPNGRLWWRGALN